jgi:hypothetical protein
MARPMVSAPAGALGADADEGLRMSIMRVAMLPASGGVAETGAIRVADCWGWNTPSAGAG